MNAGQTIFPWIEMRTQAMQRPLAILLFFLCTMASAQGKYRAGQDPINQSPSDYTIDVHVSATHFRQCATVEDNARCVPGIYIDAVVDGKKIELFGSTDKHQSVLIVPGEYRAMLLKKPPSSSSEALFQRYYLLLPDKTAWPCEITGLSQ